MSSGQPGLYLEDPVLVGQKKLRKGESLSLGQKIGVPK
jgi:hypothetical protein